MASLGPGHLKVRSQTVTISSKPDEGSRVHIKLLILHLKLNCECHAIVSASLYYVLVKVRSSFDYQRSNTSFIKLNAVLSIIRIIMV